MFYCLFLHIFTYCKYTFFNRPGVARAVLQSPPSVINWFIKCTLWKYLHWLLIGPQITWPVQGLSLVNPSPPPQTPPIFFTAPSVAPENIKYWCYYPHRSRDSLSPVYGIFKRVILYRLTSFHPYKFSNQGVSLLTIFDGRLGETQSEQNICWMS